MSLTEITINLITWHCDGHHFSYSRMRKTADWYCENEAHDKLFETWWNNFDEWYDKKEWN